MRIVLGNTTGYVMGCIESAKSILYVSASLYVLSQTLDIIFNFGESTIPVYGFIFFLISIITKAFDIKGSNYLSLLGLLVLLIFLFYIILPSECCQLEKYANLRNQGIEKTDITKIMKTLPIFTWLFIGIDDFPIILSSVNDKVSIFNR